MPRNKTRFGTNAINRILGSLERAIGKENLDKMAKGAEFATAPIQALNNVSKQTPTPMGAVARAQEARQKDLKTRHQKPRKTK